MTLTEECLLRGILQQLTTLKSNLDGGIAGSGDMLKTTYDPNNDGKIDIAQTTGFGTIADQDYNDVNITGGSIDGIELGVDVSFANGDDTMGAMGIASSLINFLKTPSSANLKSAVTDETGSGALVFATSPTLVTPNLGTPSALVLTNATGLPIAGGGTGASTAKGAVTNLCTVVDNANTTITLGTSDSGTIIRTTSSSAVTVNLPASDPGAGFNAMVIQAGSGQVTFAANGNTLNSANSYLKIGVQHGAASLIRTATSTYNLSGYLAA